jgi:uncharacterized protein
MAELDSFDLRGDATDRVDEAQLKHHEHGVLMGPLGLRAGWGILLYFVLALALAALSLIGLFQATGQAKRAARERREAHAAAQQAKAAHRPVPQHPEALVDVGLTEMAQAGGALLAGVALAALERRRFRVYGLPAGHLPNALRGAVYGLVAISLLVGLLRAAHLLIFDSRLLAGGAALRYGTGWLLVFLVVGVFEEFLFRGYIQFTLTRGLLRAGERISPHHPRKAAFWLAALAWSVLFSVTHLANAGEDPMGLVMVFVAGILFSYALWRTGSLWWGIGFHMTWDWGQSFLFGVPDSGTLSAGRLFATHPAGAPLLSGAQAGPEGSLLVLPVLALVALVIRLHPQAEQPTVEPEQAHGPQAAFSGSAIP